MERNRDGDWIDWRQNKNMMAKWIILRTKQNRLIVTKQNRTGTGTKVTDCSNGLSSLLKRRRLIGMTVLPINVRSSLLSPYTSHSW